MYIKVDQSASVVAVLLSLNCICLCTTHMMCTTRMENIYKIPGDHVHNC